MGRPTSGFPPGVKDLSPSVTITPAPPQPIKVQLKIFILFNNYYSQPLSQYS